MKTVSLIVPIYNEHTILRDCLDCIVRQDYPKVEVILVDDGSDERCLAISREYRDSFSSIQLIECENSGVSHARNVGIRVAKGELITFVDSDDLISPTFVSSLVAQFDEEEVDIAVSGWAFTSTKHRGRFVQGTYRKVTASDASIKFADGVGWFCASKMYRRGVLPDGLFDEGVTVCEDLLFNMGVLKRCRNVAIGNGVDYLYRQTTGSVTNSLNNPKWFEILDAYTLAMGMTDSKTLLARLNYSLQFALCEANYRVDLLSGQARENGLKKIERAKGCVRLDLPMNNVHRAKLGLFKLVPRTVMSIRRRRIG